MPLTLKVLSFKGQPVSQAAVMIDSQGTIGRSDGHTLVLPDPEKFVSRHHATITMQDGLYYLTDCSLSGVFIDEQEQALHEGTQQLVNGMMLRIGEYEIAVSIDSPSVAQDFSDFPFANTETTSSTDYFFPASDFSENRLLSEQSSPFVKHEELIQSSDEEFHPEFESQLQGGSVLFDNFIAPAVTTNPFTVDEIPEDFSFEDLLGTPSPQTPKTYQPDVALHKNEPKPPIHEADKVKPPTTSEPSHNALFDAFLQGASINYRIASDSLPDTLYRVGQMFRHFISGTVAVLRNRTAFKSSLRLDMTLIHASENNPLKFAVTTDDVIRQFLENKTNGFLGSIESIDQGFDDMINHQLAMQAGIEAAVANLLKTLNPENIEKQIEQGILLQKKAKCWDKYEEIYRHTADDAIDNFFGAAFAEAYQQQMKQLATKRHNR